MVVCRPHGLPRQMARNPIFAGKGGLPSGVSEAEAGLGRRGVGLIGRKLGGLLLPGAPPNRAYRLCSDGERLIIVGTCDLAR